MTKLANNWATDSAECVLGIFWLTYADANTSEMLTRAQWTALRYFAVANRFSRIASAYARYSRNTQGTVSGTVDALVARGLVVRRHSEADRRRINIEVTARGHSLLEHDPFRVLVDLISDLPPRESRTLEATLEKIISELARTRSQQRLGRCARCRHLRTVQTDSAGATDSRCDRFHESIDSTDASGLCIGFEGKQGGTS